MSRTKTGLFAEQTTAEVYISIRSGVTSKFKALRYDRQQAKKKMKRQKPKLVELKGYVSRSHNLILLRRDGWVKQAKSCLMAELHVIGQVLGASGFKGHSVFCKVLQMCPRN
jgi:hypothetical protein